MGVLLPSLNAPVMYQTIFCLNEVNTFRWNAVTLLAGGSRYSNGGEKKIAWTIYVWFCSTCMRAHAHTSACTYTDTIT